MHLATRSSLCALPMALAASAAAAHGGHGAELGGAAHPVALTVLAVVVLVGVVAAVTGRFLKGGSGKSPIERVSQASPAAASSGDARSRIAPR
jgi:hypothetical protein